MRAMAKPAGIDGPVLLDRARDALYGKLGVRLIGRDATGWRARLRRA